MPRSLISVIICSINPDLASKTIDNLTKTAGLPLEVHVIDNRHYNRPISQVYNEGAQASEASYLLFIHEDVLFETENWGRILTSKLEEQSCGVIGLAGSTLWLPGPYAWWDVPEEYHRCNYRHIENRQTQTYILPAGHPGGFMPVISLDGVAMAVRREVWAKFPFDEKALTGFHCYDIDFSVEISRHYTNYVNYDIRLLHLSSGKYDQRWLEISEKVFFAKWKDLPTLTVDCFPSNLQEIKDKAMYRYVFRRIRTSAPKSQLKKLIHTYATRDTITGIRLKRTATLYWHYLTHKTFKKNC